MDYIIYDKKVNRLKKNKQKTFYTQLFIELFTLFII